jgi:hypothetical protein
MSNILRAVAASAMILAVGGSAIAESPEYCHDYAAAAVIAAGQNLAYRCGYSGPRWATNFAAHYSWCLGAIRPDTIRERIARHDMIIACHGKKCRPPVHENADRTGKPNSPMRSA